MPTLRQRGGALNEVPEANSGCQRCGTRFRCGMVGGDGECWCAGLPAVAVLPVPPAGSAASCFCPACLEAVRAERLGAERRQ
ncbi:MAG: cysteine-rich CWC family protein [Rhodocyclales bacterium]|nr:cysteine-rich CWC family protein [Rhodocyclales bacterium]